jgi:hypothetical protein
MGLKEEEQWWKQIIYRWICQSLETASLTIMM